MPDLITHHHQVEHNRAVMVYLEQAGVEHLDWELEHQSRQSRYECVTFSKSEVDRLAVRLARIEQTVNTIIQPAPRQQQSE